MDIGDILKILPHRYPFLLIDRVIELVRMKSIVALKNVTITEPFSGHFPEKPIMPGVLIVEAIAQAGGLLLLTEVGNTRRVADGVHGDREGALPASGGAGRSAAD